MHDTALHQSTDPRTQEYAAYCAVLRDALDRLIESLEAERQWRGTPLASVFNAGWAIDAAKEALAMDTGRQAVEELRLMEELNSLGYSLANYAHAQIWKH